MGSRQRIRDYGRWLAEIEDGQHEREDCRCVAQKIGQAARKRGLAVGSAKDRSGSRQQKREDL